MAQLGRAHHRDWLVALVACVLVVATAVAEWLPLQRLELTLYDEVVTRAAAPDGGAASRVALVEIGPQSEDRLGSWPWSRAVLADTTDRLGAAGARAVALVRPLSHPRNAPGLASVEKALATLRNSRVSRAAPRTYRALENRLVDAHGALDGDARLAAAMERYGSVYLPMRLAGSGGGEETLPDFVRRHRLTEADLSWSFNRDLPLPALKLRGRDGPVRPAAASGTLPAEAFGSHAAGVGALGYSPGPDGVIRSLALTVTHGADHYPSLTLLLGGRALGVGADALRVDPGYGVGIGEREVPTDREMRFHPGFVHVSGARAGFSRHAFHELDDAIEAGRFEGKVVVVGPAASVSGWSWATSSGARASRAEILANGVASLTEAQHYHNPRWGVWADWAALAAATLVCVLVLPHVRVWLSLVLSAGLALLFAGGEIYLLLFRGLWIEAGIPAAMMLGIGGPLTARRALRARRLAVIGRAVEDERELGATYLSQGKLDAAMERLRELPADDSVAELIYNLAREYERRGEYLKAFSAYDYVLSHVGGFRDAAERRDGALDMEVKRGVRQRSRASELERQLQSGDEEAPTLGRYRIEEQLGQGAMGAVYLGRDPRINRVVAIKTLALTDAFQPDEVEEARRRFFHEARVAGQLNHPHIVTIYDVGEDEDLAYIAMEHLEGKDLRHYLGRSQGMPVNRIMETVAQIAEALDYAHRCGVIHRDIKPSNVILDAETGQVKVADFGIADIGEASRSSAGTVMGTPPYMSPEQLAGEALDGRSDIFSLGALLYELLAGRRPFRGNNLEELMTQIRSAKPTAVTEFRGGVPVCLQNILEKALQKDPDKRFQTARAMQIALLRCIKNNYATQGQADTGAR